MNINDVHWMFSNNVTKEHPKSLMVNFYDFLNHLQFFYAIFENAVFYIFLFYLHWGLLKLDFTIDTFLLCTQ